MLRRVLIALLALAFLAASATPAAYAQAPAMPAVPAIPPAAETPPTSVAEYQGASCLVGGIAAAVAGTVFGRGLLTVAAAAVAGCAVGWLGSPHLLTLWRKVQ
jgi:hypothetical protein